MIKGEFGTHCGALVSYVSFNYPSPISLGMDTNHMCEAIQHSSMLQLLYL